MRRNQKAPRRRRARTSRASGAKAKLLKRKSLATSRVARKPREEPKDPCLIQQLRHYEDGVRYFQHQKFHKAKQEFERVAAGPGKELADRAQVHLRICEQRILRAPESSPRSAEEHYHRVIAKMNLGDWDEARESLQRARKLATKSDYIYYALAALDCLTGEADAALGNLKLAIDLRPENRYHARNDEDFAFLQEDPRFTELLYPEGDGAAN